MSNEWMFLGTTLLSLGIAVGCAKLGKVWLQGFLATAYVITLCITPKFIDLFGMATTVSIITYSGIFLATDILTERYGRAVGYQTVKISLFMTLVFVALVQLTLLFEPVPFAAANAQAMDTVFGSSLRIMLAGFTTYFVAQHFDVWWYDQLHKWTGDTHLWLRNNVSTICSQFLDSLMFFTLAFYGTMPNDQFFQVLLLGFLLKAGIALCDTPFMYLARQLTPLDRFNLKS